MLKRSKHFVDLGPHQAKLRWGVGSASLIHPKFSIQNYLYMQFLWSKFDGNLPERGYSGGLVCREPCVVAHPGAHALPTHPFTFISQSGKKPGDDISSGHE